MEYKNNQSTSPSNTGDWNCPQCDFLNNSDTILCNICNYCAVDINSWICNKCAFENASSCIQCQSCSYYPPHDSPNSDWKRFQSASTAQCSANFSSSSNSSLLITSPSSLELYGGHCTQRKQNEGEDHDEEEEDDDLSKNKNRKNDESDDEEETMKEHVAPSPSPCNSTTSTLCYSSSSPHERTKQDEQDEQDEEEPHVPHHIRVLSSRRRTILLVSNVCRNNEKWLRSRGDNLFCNIPNLIRSLIGKYHGLDVSEYWDVHGAHSFFPLDDRLTVQKKPSPLWKDTCYGNVRAPSMSRNCVFEWKLLIHRMMQPTGDYMIGISSAAACPANAIFDKVGTGGEYQKKCPVHSYAYCGADATVRQNGDQYVKEYGQGYRDKDVVTVKLQFCDGSRAPALSFGVNGQDHGVAFDNIAVGKKIEYRLVVCMCWGNCSISIKKFDIYDTVKCSL